MWDLEGQKLAIAGRWSTVGLEGFSGHSGYLEDFRKTDS